MKRFPASILLLAFLSGTALAAPQPPHNTGSLAAQIARTDDETPSAAISVSAAGAPSIEGAGALEGSKGLTSDLWKNSTRDTAAPLLHYIHTGVASDPMRDLLTRALMTEAAPPAGTGEDWFVLRVHALIAMGEDIKADQMIVSLPASMTAEPLKRMHAELMLTRGETDGACKLSPGEPIPFWQKLSVLCKVHSGKQDDAMVGLDMLNEMAQHEDDDAFFQEAVRKMSDKQAAIKSYPKQWSLLDVAALRMTGDAGALKDHLDALPPAALKYIAQDASLDIKLREKATARAQLIGLIPVKEANKTPEQPFERSLASDVTTLVNALGSGRPANSDDSAIIARMKLGEDAGIQDSRRALRLLTLMEPFGYKVPPEVWQKLFTHKLRFDGEVPPAMLVERLHDAVQGSRKGEVIVLSGLILAGSDPDRVSELALLPVVHALKNAGYEKEARAIAYSAVKAYAK